MNNFTRSLLFTSALVLPVVGAQAQTAQTFNMQVPSANSSYTDGSGNIYTLNIPSTINIGTLTFSSANSGPSIASSGSEGTCGSGVSTCTGGGLALTSGDKLIVRMSGDQTAAATPVTITGTGTISSCATMTNGSVAYNTSQGHIYFMQCSITASGTATGVVAHYSASTTLYADVKAWDVHGGSDHGNGASATGNSASPTVTTAAGTNGQPSANALIFSTTESWVGYVITQSNGWTVDVNGNGVEVQHIKNPAAGAVTAATPLATSDQWGEVIVAVQ